eukprot:7003790-Ditylum_brightwellii.AAC.2
MIIHARGADTCTDCMVLQNKFRSLAPVRRQATAKEARNDCAGEDNSDGSNMSISSSDDEEDVDEDEIKWEITKMQASLAQ